MAILGNWFPWSLCISFFFLFSKLLFVAVDISSTGLTETNVHCLSFSLRFLFLICDVLMDCFFVMGVWTILLSLMMTSSTMVTLAGGSSSKGVYPNSYPGSSSGSLMLSSNSIYLLKMSVRTFLVPAINSKLMFCDSISTAQLFTFAFIVFSSRNFFSGRWLLLNVICAESK